MSEIARQRIDLWLWRARFAKTRAEASRLVAEGGVRLMHEGVLRRLDKPSVTLAAGDALIFTHNGAMRAVRVNALALRRGPPAEAHGLYVDLDAPER